MKLKSDSNISENPESKLLTNSISNINRQSISSFDRTSIINILHNIASNNQDNIKVILRIRPKTQKEFLLFDKSMEIKDNTIFIYPDDKKTIKKVYSFDYIANENCSQEKIFQKCAKTICDSVLEGYNGTIFVYGQTGSGKTYTMLGPDYYDTSSLNYVNNFGNNFYNINLYPNKMNDIIKKGYISFMQKKEAEGKGIIPRSIEYLLEQKELLCNMNNKINIKIYCSFYEIYNDQIFDLFNNPNLIDSPPLSIREKIGFVYVDGLKKFEILTKNDAYNLLKLGASNRHTFSTKMNSVSSRSHAIFSIMIKIIQNNSETNSIFNLVDLAGSERQNVTDCIGDRIKEAGKINKALSNLSKVIQLLSNNKNNSNNEKYIPYRDSKLTFLLKDSLGGNSKTCFIATISPCTKNIQESISTLNFARDARGVQNNLLKNISQKDMTINDNIQINKNMLKNEEENYNTLKAEIIYLLTVFQQIGVNDKEISKFRDKFIQNSKSVSFINEDFQKISELLKNKKKLLDDLVKENNELQKEIENISVSLKIKETIFDNLDSQYKEALKDFHKIEKDLESIILINNEKKKIYENEKNIYTNIVDRNNKIKNDLNSEIQNKKNLINIKENVKKSIEEIMATNQKNIQANIQKSKNLNNEIDNLRNEIKALNTALNESEDNLVSTKNKKLEIEINYERVKNILKNIELQYNHKIIINLDFVAQLNMIINNTSLNKEESVNQLLVAKNKINEFDIYLEILQRKKIFLENTLNNLKNNNLEKELELKKTEYNSLLEINKNLKMKLNKLNTEFDKLAENPTHTTNKNDKFIQKNRNNNNKKGSKCMLIKLKDENFVLDEEINKMEQNLNEIHLINHINIFEYSKNLDNNINIYSSFFDEWNKKLLPFTEKFEIKNQKLKTSEDEKLKIFSYNLKNAVFNVIEKEKLISKIEKEKENLGLKTLNTIRKNDINIFDLSKLNDKEIEKGEIKETNYESKKKDNKVCNSKRKTFDLCVLDDLGSELQFPIKTKRI